jgi:hypothetical protein
MRSIANAGKIVVPVLTLQGLAHDWCDRNVPKPLRIVESFSGNRPLVIAEKLLMYVAKTDIKNLSLLPYRLIKLS